MQDNPADAHLFDIDVHSPDLPRVAALNTTISPDEVFAAVNLKALKRNKASDVYGMLSKFIIDTVLIP